MNDPVVRSIAVAVACSLIVQLVLPSLMRSLTQKPRRRRRTHHRSSDDVARILHVLASLPTRGFPVFDASALGVDRALPLSLNMERRPGGGRYGPGVV